LPRGSLGAAQQGLDFRAILRLMTMTVRELGRRPYGAIWQAMRDFTAARNADTADELWLVEHEPVFTQGLAGRDAHVLAAGGIPVVRTDRGGQVTYHGPGQVVAYPLVDLKRVDEGRGIYVKEYVYRIEQAVIDTLASFDVVGHRVRGAPGIYVRLDEPFAHAVLDANEAAAFKGLGKIAALGIKVSNHRTYHGVALNVAMDLEPFARIDPCGYAGLRTIDLAGLGITADPKQTGLTLADALQRRLA
jgi:lipoyl(octanoyl) transferase